MHLLVPRAPKCGGCCATCIRPRCWTFRPCLSPNPWCDPGRTCGFVHELQQLCRDLGNSVSVWMGEVTKLGIVGEVSLDDIEVKLASRVVLTSAPKQPIEVPWCVPASPEIWSPVHPRGHRVIELPGIRIGSLNWRIVGNSITRWPLGWTGDHI